MKNNLIDISSTENYRYDTIFYIAVYLIPLQFFVDYFQVMFYVYFVL